jgi:hypothetical protein
MARRGPEGGSGRRAIQEVILALRPRAGCLRVPRLACFAMALLAPVAFAANISADPTNYRQRVKALHAGDTLRLAPGVYRNGLDVHGLAGTSAAPIAIVGSTTGTRTVFRARAGRNTVSIVDSAYVRIADLDLEGRGAFVDGVKAEGKSHFAHHITLERLVLRGFDGNQQIVGISTKCPAWNWVIRDNVIEGAGTGMYLGDSDGSAPFMRGTIEGNTIVGTRGYSIEIKHQMAWPALADAPQGRGATIIRYNAFAKDGRSSTEGLARPNLLLGHWPLTGRGSGDRYLVYGNLIVDNPHESLVQMEGNVVFYNNVLVNRFDDGLAVREHKDLPRTIDAFHNTIVAKGVGALLRNGDPRFVQRMAANVIHAGQVVPASLAGTNDVRSYDDVTTQDLIALVDAPDRDEVAPLPSKPRPIAASRHVLVDGSLPDTMVDFDRRRRSRDTDGAYAGDWPPDPRRFIELGLAIRDSRN